MQKLFIPNKIRVGCQKRDDTYTGQLAYVIYYDEKGTLRKEKSWQSWRDQKIEPNDFENKPTSGFVLNKKVGGYKSDWNFRQSYVRVYDPRNFEFEITVENLLFILSQCDCTKGKGLEGEFVYSWSGTDLVLLPVESESYKQSVSYTDLQSQKILAKELILGASYEDKNQKKLTYVGKFLHRELYRYNYGKNKPPANEYIFWDGKEFVFHKDMKKIARLISSNIHADYSNLVQKYQESTYFDEPIELVLEQSTLEECKTSYDHTEYIKTKDGFRSIEYEYEYNRFDKPPRYMHYTYTTTLKDGQIHRGWESSTYIYNPLTASRNYEQTKDWKEPEYKQLYVIMKSGAKHKIYG